MAIEDVYGQDFSHVGDIELTPTGDIDKLTGLANVKEAIYRRIVTEKGSLIHRPDYGVGLKRYLNSINSLTKQAELARNIKEQVELDPRIVEVTGVRIVPSETPELVQILVRVKVQGYDEATLSFQPFGEGV